MNSAANPATGLNSSEQIGHSFPCEKCGANLTFNPGTESLKCRHCGHESEIHESVSPILEYDFHSTLQKLDGAAPSVQNNVIDCHACGAQFEFEQNMHAAECPFCGTAVISESKQHRQIQPRSLLPFRIDEKSAHKAYEKWLNRLWFAPNSLKKLARKDRPMHGMYVPYWTYDSYCVTHYRGQRGTIYHVPETVRVKINGNWTTQTRMVAKIRWIPVSGVVERNFDDVLVYASDTLPRNMAHELEPWDIDQLTPYQAQYLSGFQSEMYQVPLEQGFDIAKSRMHPVIRQDIHADIGGDRQQISQMQTQYNKIRFKHILLPFWVAGFRYRQKNYQFIINGRTGEVHGKRPYSWIKITLAAIAAAIASVVIGYYAIESGALEFMLQQGFQQF